MTLSGSITATDGTIGGMKYYKMMIESTSLMLEMVLQLPMW